MNPRLLADELLIYGFIRQETDKEAVHIPPEIQKVVLDFYPPKLAKFELYSSERFQLINGGFEIQGTSDARCDGYLIYPEALHPDGMRTGVHFWSLLLVGAENVKSYCFHSVGIVSGKRDTALLDQIVDRWPEEWDRVELASMDCNGDEPLFSDYYYYNPSEHGCSPEMKRKHYWGYQETMTVKLDCDKGTVEYFKSGELLRSKKIDKTKSYYFAMTSCILPDNWFRVVETPEDILHR